MSDLFVEIPLPVQSSAEPARLAGLNLTGGRGTHSRLYRICTAAFFLLRARALSNFLSPIEAPESSRLRLLSPPLGLLRSAAQSR